MTDQQLLRDYTGSRSESAFAELVRRHIDLVYSAALRMVCDSHLAEDVTQSVFVALAKNARALTEHPVLSGWLHRTTQNLAANVVRSDVRRRAREQEAVAMNELISTADPDAAWEHIAPHLDAALGELSEPDRDALMLRYFERKSAREMAQTFGISDDAAQKRVNRAVERLREFFAKRGVTVGTSGLVVVISTNAVQAAPVGLNTVIVAAAIAKTISVATIATHTTVTTMKWINTKAVAAMLASALVVGTATYLAQQNKFNRLRTENENLVATKVKLTDERDAALVATKRKQDELVRSQNDKSELLRLRSEVGRLRQQANELGKLREENQRLQTAPPPIAQTPVRQRFVPAIPSGNNNASWTSLGPRPDRSDILWAMADAGVGDKFPVQEKGNHTLFEVTVKEGDDDHVVVEISSEGNASQGLELLRDKTVPVRIGERKFELLFPTTQVNPTDKPTTEKAHFIVTYRP